MHGVSKTNVYTDSVQMKFRFCKEAMRQTIKNIFLVSNVHLLLVVDS